MFAATIFQAGGLGAALGSPIIMMAVVMGIFYVMLILPQQKQRKKLQEMLGALKTGDKVITNGGPGAGKINRAKVIQGQHAVPR